MSDDQLPFFDLIVLVDMYEIRAFGQTCRVKPDAASLAFALAVLSAGLVVQGGRECGFLGCPCSAGPSSPNDTVSVSSAGLG